MLYWYIRNHVRCHVRWMPDASARLVVESEIIMYIQKVQVLRCPVAVRGVT